MTSLTSTASRRFIGTIAATAMALAVMTAAAIPARAGQDSDDFARALAALAAIAIIGKTVHDNRRRDPVAQPVTPHRTRPEYRDHKIGRRAIKLPAQCAIETRTYRSRSVVYAERCLRRNGIKHRLPEYCATQVVLRNRVIKAYPKMCLLDAGFRVKGRRWN